ncbi:MAG: phospholipid carrier-dependent glycosyltransferase [Actinobacteria bacterium]|nr:phospholipid carrier-dependent glycosyltransferase [Actinomycetota bacterium]
MTRLRLIAGLAVAGVVGTVVVIAVRRLRTRVLPNSVGLETVLADVVLVVTVVSLVANALGTFGWFSAWPLAVAMLLAAGVVWLVAGVGAPAGNADRASTGEDRPGAGHSASSGRVIEPAWVASVARGAVAVAGIGWLVTLASALGHGIDEWDSVWYHLPAAADFVRFGSFLPLRLYGADIAISTYPMGSEVFHAIGMIVTGSDILGPFVNAGWAVVALVAAFQFGRRYGTPNLAMLGAVCLLATRGVLTMTSATAQAEMMAMAFIIAAMAFMVRPDGTSDRSARLVLVGLSSGLVASTKLTMLLPAVVLVGAAIVIAWTDGRPRRVRDAVSVAGGAFVSGSYWYLRNWWRFGSPLPEFTIHVGPISFRHVEVAGELGPMLPTLVHVVVSRSQRELVAATLGPAWFALLAVPLLVVPIALRSRRRAVVVLAVASVLMFLAGLMTPQYTLHGVYETLGANMRYLFAGIVTAFVVVAASMRSRRESGVLAFGFALVAGASFLGFLSDPPLTFRRGLVGRTILLAAMAVIGVVAHRLRSARPVQGGARTPRPVWFGATVAVLSVGIVTVAVQPSYLANHYRLSRPDYLGSSAGNVDQVFRWAAGIHDQRIGVAPYTYADWIARTRIETNGDRQSLMFTYGLEGVDRSNLVESIATFDGYRVVRPETCAQWWTRLEELQIGYVMLWEPPAGGHSADARYNDWTRASSATSVVVRVPLGPVPHAHLVVYRIDPHRPPACVRRGPGSFRRGSGVRNLRDAPYSGAP